MVYRFIIFIITLNVIFESNAQVDNTGVLRGTVIEQKSRLPLQNAEIQIIETGKTIKTDSVGNFHFENLLVGKYTLKVFSFGYLTKVVPGQSIIKNKLLYLSIEMDEDVRAMDEVEVVTYRYENDKLNPVSTYSFSRDEISLNPGAQGDIFRAIGMLPGVTSSGGIYSAIAVRGQGVRDNVYMVDDIPLTEVGHLEGNSFFNDPNGGRFSIFAPRVIDNAVFQSGSFSTEFGRRSASYLGLNIKEGNKGSSIYDGQIDLLGVSANYDGPSHIHNNTTMFISARYQNFYPLVNLIGLKNLGLPIYSDFIIKTTTELNEFNKLNTLLMICPESFVRNMDNLYEDKPLNLLYLPDFARNKIVAGLNLRSILNSNLVLKNILYYTNYSSDVEVGRAYPEKDSTGNLKSEIIPSLSKIQTQMYRENKWGFRSVLETYLNSKSSMSIGLEGDLLQLINERELIVNDTNFIFRRLQLADPSKNYQVITPDLVNSSFNDLRANASVFANFFFEIGSKFSAQIGGRVDYSGFSKQTVFAPRSSLSYNIDNNQILSLGIGIYYQDPIYSDIADLPTGNTLKMEEVSQLILSYKAYISNDLKLTIEGWYKSFDNMVVTPISGSVLRNNNGFGEAKGFDISMTKRLHKKWHGIASYSYMDVKRNDGDGLGNYDFTYSQPHQFNIMLSYQLNQNWSFSGKYRYATGRPTDKYIIHENVLNNPHYYLYSMELIGKNLSRLPDFSSLDLRMNYDFVISKYKFTMFFDIVNILNKQIANGENFNSLKGETYFDGLAIFPTGGLKFEF